MTSFWRIFNTVEAIWITQVLWMVWAARSVLLRPVRRASAAALAPLWRRLSLDGDDLE